MCFNRDASVSAARFSSRLLFLLTLSLAMGAGSCHLAGAVTYYVSESEGNDLGTGLSPEDPFQTIARVNQLVLAPGDDVLFRCGDVWRMEMLIVKDSGTAENPITIGTYPAECENRPVLSGSLPISGWTPYAPDIYVADLSAGANLEGFPLGLNQLFREGHRLVLGRWPNLDEGYSFIDIYEPPFRSQILIRNGACDPETCPLEPVSPAGGTPVTEPPTLQWTAGIYDVYRVYLVVPLFGTYHVIPTPWLPGTSLDLNLYQALWPWVAQDAWAGRLVLGLDMETYDWETTAPWWFRWAP